MNRAVEKLLAIGMLKRQVFLLNHDYVVRLDVQCEVIEYNGGLTLIGEATKSYHSPGTIYSSKSDCLVLPKN